MLMKRSFARTSSFFTSSPWVIDLGVALQGGGDGGGVCPHLDVCVPCGTEQLGDAGAAHRRRDRLDGRLQARQQLGQVTWIRELGNGSHGICCCV